MRANGGGGGLVGGIQFVIGKRLVIFTETNLYFTHADTLSEFRFTGQPDISESGTSDNFSLELPTSIFFGFTF